MNALLSNKESFNFPANTDQPLTMGDHTEDQAILMQMRANDYSCG